MRAGGSAADHPGDLPARGVRQVGLVLIQAAGLQHIGEGHPGGVDVDQHRVLGGGFGDVHQLRGLRSVQTGNLNRAHTPSLSSTPLFNSCAKRSQPTGRLNPRH
ncbi:hypothetical protein MHAS44199_01795 [Mycolicibacterium hassiacum DSM 44199]|nr:hypothetical protein [Mycolicibacterium hassiacum DSM 44199]